MELIQLQIPNNPDKWEVTVGQETFDLLSNLKINDFSKSKLLSETQQILEQCGNPKKSTSNETGLVFGYVQSGKTMSFTMLTALAKDNGYQIIIIIAGIATNLIDQSTTRLEKDLRINERMDRQWLSIKNPNKQDVGNLNDKLQECKDPNFPDEEKRTILITVLKNTTHLRNMIDVFKYLDLNNVPTLIIDDESDQASLNTFEQKNAKDKDENKFAETRLSTIYRRILDIKKILPHHTFVQYTATPQANLFFNIYRELSPNFIQLLTAGEEYTGGNVFFKECADLIQIIPEQDLTLTSPPNTLLEAMRWFFLGVAKGKKNNENKNRSMMIHPSEKTSEHSLYTHWVINTKNEWVDILQNQNDQDISKKTLIGEFEKTYNKLAQTATDIPPFDEILKKLLHSIRGTRICEVNAKGGKTPNINWHQDYAFILIGGNAMSRGYTVEGLTVTYMPRSIGGGMVDTIQQRARFFGYKRSYLNYCKIYLIQDAKIAYEEYVTHEEDMRMRLEQHKQSGKSLNEWYREVFLPDFLKLTRSNVIYDELSRSSFSDEWFFIKNPCQNIPNNQKAVQQFIQHTNLQPYDSATQEYEMVYLKTIIELLFNKVSYENSDLSSIKNALTIFCNENPNELCRVYLLGTFEKPRERKKIANGIFSSSGQLFQGSNANYKGDATLRQKIGASFQIHIVNIFDENKAIFAEGVPIVAIYIPDNINPETIKQTYQTIEE